MENYEQLAKDAIDDLYADVEGQPLTEYIAKLERVQDHLTARIEDLQCDTGLHGGN